MKFSTNKSIVTLVILLITAFHITDASSSTEQDAAVPFHINSSSTQEKRLLNTNCATFQFVSGNWRVDGDISKQTIYHACDPNIPGPLYLDCCNDGNGGAVNDNGECTFWNTALPYTICNGACKGTQACGGIARHASGGSVKINSNACTSEGACLGIGGYITGHVDIEIGQDACTSIDYVCYELGRNAQSVTGIEVPANECNEENTAGVNFPSGDQVAKCQACGSSSAFEGTFQATDACCAADGYYYYSNFYNDEACNYTPPPEEPSNPCKNVSCSNRGKCQVLSLTEAECKCENTFIPSENKLDCICPSNHEFHADVNRCFPITEAPSKSPTVSPTKTSSASPSQVPTSQEDVCEDDETATFQLINQKKRFQPCSWITKNWRKRVERQENYCGLDHVKAICPASCGLCYDKNFCEDDETATFQLINEKKRFQPCSWITKNWRKRVERQENYCGRDHVKAICPASCGMCPKHNIFENFKLKINHREQE